MTHRLDLLQRDWSIFKAILLVGAKNQRLEVFWIFQFYINFKLTSIYAFYATIPNYSDVVYAYKVNFSDKILVFMQWQTKKGTNHTFQRTSY